MSELSNYRTVQEICSIAETANNIDLQKLILRVLLDIRMSLEQLERQSGVQKWGPKINQ